MVGMPGDDAVPMVLHEGDEVLDGLQTGAFRAGAPAAQVLGCVAGVLVVLPRPDQQIWAAAMADTLTAAHQHATAARAAVTEVTAE